MIVKTRATKFKTTMAMRGAIAQLKAMVCYNLNEPLYGNIKI